MMRLALESFESYIKLNKKIPEEVLRALQKSAMLSVLATLLLPI